ncbi:MAG: ATP-grasp domain-containing protein [Actinomycetia bacterium]|nr:ATP-grasp domain-containing protein [Actinomycetes bacterium]
MVRVAITDVYTPSMRYTRAFREAGHEVIRVQSTDQVPALYRPGLSQAELDEVFCANLSPTEARARLAELKPVAVLAGGECGVELADELAERLGLPGNGTRLSEARRNKYVQVEAVRARGLRATRQLLVRDADQLRAWHADLGRRVVVKPLRSAGNDGVRFCASPHESVAAYQAILAADTIFSEPNTGAVAQELIVGTEYVVNTVSWDGQHRVTDVWRYTKLSANQITDRVSAAVSVAPGHSAWPSLTSYALEVLEALEIQYGPAHLEIILTREGPCLVELGARLSGADTAYYAALATGSSQIDWAVQAVTDPARFHARLTAPAQLQQHVAMYFLTSPVAGTLVRYPRLDEVRALPSFHNLVTVVKPGGRLSVTVDDTTEPMMVGLAHPEESVLERDLLTLHYLDGDGFYEVGG